MAAFAVIGAFFVVGIVADIATGALGYWHVLGSGFFAAMATVVSAFIAAPKRKFMFASFAFVIGVAVAWYFLEPSWYPENYGAKAYQPTHLPIVVTCLGGVLGLIFAAIPWLRSRRKS
ncbi:hypothetical protein GCM10027277_08290 [Pseudoduganella ginsengisoli]